MKFLPLIWKNARRSKRRTILTLGGISVSFFIFCAMHNTVTSMQAWEGESDKYNRLGVMSATSMTVDLPISHEDYLKSLPDIELIYRSNWFGGIYKDDPKNFFGQFAGDADTAFTLWEEYKLPREQIEAYKADKQGAVIGSNLAKRFDLKIGDKMHLKGTIYSFDVDLNVRGIYEFAKDPSSLFFHYDYFNELNGNKGEVGMFWIKARPGTDVKKLISTIDGHFKNSPDPTRTNTEKEFARMFQSMMGNMAGMVRMLGIVITVIILLVVANTMAMAARERIVETSMMKTLGFTSAQILGMVLSEALFVSLAGAAIGCGAAVLAFNVCGWTPIAFFEYFKVMPETLGKALAVALIVGVGSGIVPAVRAARRNIVEGLRQVV